jgi:serine O-acetyltransferase
MFETIRADVARLTDVEPGVVDKLGVVMLHLGLHAVLSYRLARWLHRRHLRLPAALLSYVSSVITGAQISPRASIGKGFVIYHPHGIVIGADAVVGDDCTLVHANVIGQHYGGGDRAVIGDRLFAGTGAKILGRVTIGNNVRIGANAVVITSLPDRVTVAGNPARVLNRNDASSPATPADLQRAATNSAGPRRGILERLAPLIAGVLDRPTEAIDETTGLLGEGIGVDSIEILKLVCAIEEAFEVTIDEAELMPSHFRTVGSLVTFIHEQLVHGGVSA